jgi:hypothetical protein
VQNQGNIVLIQFFTLNLKDLSLLHPLYNQKIDAIIVILTYVEITNQTITNYYKDD